MLLRVAERRPQCCGCGGGEEGRAGPGAGLHRNTAAGGERGGLDAGASDSGGGAAGVRLKACREHVVLCGRVGRLVSMVGSVPKWADAWAGDEAALKCLWVM